MFIGHINYCVVVMVLLKTICGYVWKGSFCFVNLYGILDEQTKSSASINKNAWVLLYLRTLAILNTGLSRGYV